MSESFLNGRVTLHCGDCLDVLATLPENSIDSCVTDPPYHLVSIVKRFGKPNSAPVKLKLTDSQAGSPFERGARGFMGKEWDGGDIAQSVELWLQVYRVLKPGAHLLAFGGDRTFHRMACAIEDAGFEVRGTLAWIFGQGFPKNHNVSARMKASIPAHELCACGSHCLETVRDSQYDYQSSVGCGDEQPLSDQADDLETFPLLNDAREHSRADPPLDGQALGQANTGPDVETDPHSNAGFSRQSAHLLKDCQANGNIQSDKQSNKSHDEAMAAHKTAHRKSGNLHLGDDLASSLRNVNLPRCDRCGKFIMQDGLGSALKPAMELICMARKPLSEKGIAANVLKWGTGAINVDGCRIEATDSQLAKKYASVRNAPPRDNAIYGADKRARSDGALEPHTNGRWPANVIHDGSEEVVGAFPETTSHGGGTATYGGIFGNGAAVTDESAMDRFAGDSGSAARFFYTSKANSDDRLGSRHPTVKPLDLMQYLVRLVTPKGGTVLDCFAGTGTTGEAAWREGMNAVLIERETEYQADIRRRMELCLAGPDERQRESIKAKLKDNPLDHGPLFGAIA